MNITQHTDYALRVLMYLGAVPERRVTIKEVAERFDISRSHLMKIVTELVAKGFVDGVRDRPRQRGAPARTQPRARRVLRNAVALRAGSGLPAQRCAGQRPAGLPGRARPRFACRPRRQRRTAARGARPASGGARHRANHDRAPARRSRAAIVGARCTIG
ncbi:MAG: Rrf2 family transcriptional regulator [Pseudomonadales bacterium]|nr:Rrf2 family transcriptional regulator [Pseudomonadales bacterium]